MPKAVQRCRFCYTVTKCVRVAEKRVREYVPPARAWIEREHVTKTWLCSDCLEKWPGRFELVGAPMDETLVLPRLGPRARARQEVARSWRFDSIR